MILPLVDGPVAEIRDPGPIVGVEVVRPEVLILPLVDWISEDALSLLADERKLPGRQLELPNDAVNRIDQRFESALAINPAVRGLGPVCLTGSIAFCAPKPDIEVVMRREA